MELVILAGGKGTRLGRSDIPKPMVEVAGKPVLQWTIEWARRSRLRDITIISHHQAAQIVEWLGDGSRFGVRLRHIIEDEPRGTAGALRLLEGMIRDRFMVIYGDLLCEFDAQRFIDFDAAATSLGTIIVHPNNHPHDSDLVEVGADHTIAAIHSKPHNAGVCYQNLVNAAVYILDPAVIREIPRDVSVDFGRDLFPRLVREGKTLRAYRTHEYISDMGTPDRLAKVSRDVLSGKVAARHARNKQAAIFLDRDGVLNPDDSPIVDPEQMVLFPGAASAVRAINESNYLAIVITNQPGIAKGFLTENDLLAIHRKLDWELARGGAFLDGLYFCPHHPERGWPGEIAELKVACDCRKPAPGLLFRAARDFNLDLPKCYFIGDRESDMQAATAAGVTGVLLQRADSLCPAVSSIVQLPVTQ